MSNESNLLRIYCQTNLLSNDLFSDESNLLWIYSQTNLFSCSSDLVRISEVSHLNFLWQCAELPGKMILMINPCHIWDVIYNARSNRGYPPTSPNTAPATKNEFYDWSTSHMKALFSMRVRSEHDPKMIRPWTRQSATRIATEITFRAHHEHFLLKKEHNSRSGYHSNFHQMLHLPFHQILVFIFY